MLLSAAGIAGAKVPTLQPAELRSLRAVLPGVSVYPARARFEHLEGRILVEFHLNRAGQPVGTRIVKAEADASLQSQALELLRSSHYDLGSWAVDPATLFHATVIYCMDHCADLPDYPESNSLLKFTALPFPGH